MHLLVVPDRLIQVFNEIVFLYFTLPSAYQISLEYNKLELNEKKDILDFSRYLESNWKGSKKEDTKSAIIFTYNDMTKYFASEIISQWQGFGIKELVLFKDPSKAPYLCSYPSLQKGFKRPPPI